MKVEDDLLNVIKSVKGIMMGVAYSLKKNSMYGKATHLARVQKKGSNKEMRFIGRRKSTSEV